MKLTINLKDLKKAIIDKELKAKYKDGQWITTDKGQHFFMSNKKGGKVVNQNGQETIGLDELMEKRDIKEKEDKTKRDKDEETAKVKAEKDKKEGTGGSMASKMERLGWSKDDIKMFSDAQMKNIVKEGKQYKPTMRTTKSGYVYEDLGSYGEEGKMITERIGTKKPSQEEQEKMYKEYVVKVDEYFKEATGKTYVELSGKTHTDQIKERFEKSLGKKIDLSKINRLLPKADQILFAKEVAKLDENDKDYARNIALAFRKINKVLKQSEVKKSMELSDTQPLRKEDLENHLLELHTLTRKKKVNIKDLLKQLEIGVSVEKEHGGDINNRIKTVIEHLNEDMQYYTAAKPKDWGLKELKSEKIKKSLIKTITL